MVECTWLEEEFFCNEKLLNWLLSLVMTWEFCIRLTARRYVSENFFQGFIQFGIWLWNWFQKVEDLWYVSLAMLLSGKEVTT